jgi:hypothetical protein
MDVLHTTAWLLVFVVPVLVHTLHYQESGDDSGHGDVCIQIISGLQSHDIECNTYKNNISPHHDSIWNDHLNKQDNNIVT